MTEHNIAELERQHSAAKSRADQAQAAVRAAEDRLYEAKARELLAGFESMGGVVGETRVRDIGWDGKPNMRNGPFFVVGTEQKGADAFYLLAKIKKDGTTSSAGTGTWRVKSVAFMPGDNA